jgi:hypothetical protein
MPLTLVLLAVAVLACSTAVLGPLIASAWFDTEEEIRPHVELMPAVNSSRSEIQFEVASAGTPPAEAQVEQAQSAQAGPDPSPAEPRGIEVAAAVPAEPVREEAASGTVIEPAPKTAQVEPAAERRSDELFEGIWAPTEKACSPAPSRSGYLPAVINSEGAWAGETTCAFKASKRTGDTWSIDAVCSDTRSRWKANVRLSVAGNRLTWKSQRGSQTYVRCNQGLLRADGAQKPPPRA